MGEYGPGLTSGQAFMLDKERIRNALAGKLICGETDAGFEYAEAPEEECAAYILSAFDNAVFQCQKSMASGRVLERLLKEKTKMKDADILHDYIHLMQEEELKYDDYVYESDRIDD